MHSLTPFLAYTALAGVVIGVLGFAAAAFSAAWWVITGVVVQVLPFGAGAMLIGAGVYVLFGTACLLLEWCRP